MITGARLNQNLARNGRQAYLHSKIGGASDGRLLINLYDVAITACAKEDVPIALGALSELIDALNFDYGDIAIGLFRLYRYCLELVRKGRWGEVLSILKELRQAWIHALEQDEPSSDES